MVTTKPIDNKRHRLDPILLLVFLLIAGFTLMLGRIIWTMPVETAGLSEQVARHLHRSGVASPVTAVLLNFRGYDTMLEVMVLFLAVLGVWSLTTAPFPNRTAKPSPVQITVVRLLAPLMCLIAGYLVWQGSHLAGGAFQGGAILASAGVLMFVADLPWLRTVPALPLRLGLAFGPAIFLGVALWCLIRGGALLTYPAGTAGGLLLLIEAACAISIGLTLAALFAGGRPTDSQPEEKLLSEPDHLGGDE